jgi:hypothetical protein|eukprot:COSAG01_NODE_21631_length_892_cov_3.496847_1_plen_158_part_00
MEYPQCPGFLSPSTNNLRYYCQTPSDIGHFRVQTFGGGTRCSIGGAELFHTAPPPILAPFSSIVRFWVGRNRVAFRSAQIVFIVVQNIAVEAAMFRGSTSQACRFILTDPGRHLVFWLYLAYEPIINRIHESQEKQARHTATMCRCLLLQLAPGSNR